MDNTTGQDLDKICDEFEKVTNNFYFAIFAKVQEDLKRKNLAGLTENENTLFLQLINEILAEYYAAIEDSKEDIQSHVKTYKKMFQQHAESMEALSHFIVCSRTSCVLSGILDPKPNTNILYPHFKK